jgi:hypothetical protein
MNDRAPTPSQENPQLKKVDLALCVQDGDRYILPAELQATLRPGTTVQTKNGELFVTGAGLRPIDHVARDVRNGLIPSIAMANVHPLIKEAGRDFERRLKGASRHSEIFPLARRGSRGDGRN